MQSTLIIIPALNESEALPGVLADIRAHVAHADVLVVDDGSTDATAAVARANGALVARLPFNLGIGAALRTGFRYANECGYRRAVQFDADGQHDASEVVKLLEALDRGADMAVGTRFSDQTDVRPQYSVSRTRAGAMHVLRILVQLLAGQRFSDTSSGFRAFNERMLRFFSRTYPSEYMDSVEALLLARYHGFTVCELPVRMHARAAGSPSNRHFRLIYHYLRLLTVIAATASSRARRGVAS